MPYFKVENEMRYTVTVYVEADTKAEAENISGQEEGQINHDDTWIDSDASEITKEEYLDSTE